MEKRLSKFDIFIYRAFPFLFGESFGFFLVLIVLPITSILVIVATVLTLVKRHGKKGGRK
jgi:hypothetical protein